MFAARALRESNNWQRIISGVGIIRAYNIDDLFHTGRIDPPGMVKIVYIVCISKLNNTIIVVLQSKTAARWVICSLLQNACTLGS